MKTDVLCDFVVNSNVKLFFGLFLHLVLPYMSVTRSANLFL